NAQCVLCTAMRKPSLQLKLVQQLTMTPQLQQAIRLLQLPALELQAHIRELLETNVMLEPVDEGEGTGVFEAPAEEAQGQSAQQTGEHHDGDSRSEAGERPEEHSVEVLDEGW